jgi:protein O-mannosyl-transferase
VRSTKLTRKRNVKGHLGAQVLWGALIILITVIAYLPALRGGFIFDDDILITRNRLIKASDGLHRFWFTTEAADYYPLTGSLWWLEWRLWGGRAAGYHAVNIWFHAINAVLVWLVLRRLKIPGAWLAGLVFALHPVNVATVAWISEQKNTLSMFFYAAAILLYLRFDEEDKTQWYILSLAAFLLALLSKTAVVMLPVVLLGCRWWLHGTVRKKDWLLSLPFFGLSLILGLTTMWFQRYRAMGGYTDRTTSFLSRLAAAGWVPWFYLGKALWPVNLQAIYPKWNVNPSLWISYLPGVLLLGCLALFWWKRASWGRPLLFALGYFVVTLFPVLGFFDQGFYECSLVADHWQYSSIIGVIALVIAAGVALCRRLGPLDRYIGTLAGVALLAILGTASWARCSVYENGQTFWSDTLAKNPNAWLAHNNLGYLLADEGDLAGATWHYREAVRLEPDYADAHNNLGNALLRDGKTEEAIEHFERALQLKPDWPPVQNNLGNALVKMGRLQEAIESYRRAIHGDPDYAEAHYNLGNALWTTQQVPEAIQEYRETLTLQPNFARAHNNLGVLIQADKVDEAIFHYEEALKTSPDYAEAHYNLGNAFVQVDRLPEAVMHYDQALRLRPRYPDAHFGLALVLVKQGRVDEAISHLQSALEIEPGFEPARRELDELQRARGTGKPD